MKEYIAVFLIALIVSFIITPIIRKFAIRVGAVDVPKDSRRMHKVPIPKLGGLAIFIGFIFSMIVYILYSKFIKNNVFDPKIIGYFIGVFIIMKTCFIDDIKPIRPFAKLIGQVLAAFVVVVFGVRIGILSIPFGSGTIYLDYFQIPITILWIVGVTNAINFIDGLDGLAAGVSAIASLCLLSIFIFNNQLGSIIMTAALVGSIFGFLPYNFNPAKIFMGDTGSNFLGFTLAVLSITGLVKTYTIIAIVIPLLILGLPIFDTAFAIIRRLLQGNPIMKADRGHLHHRLIDSGLNVKQSVLILYTFSAVLGILAIGLIQNMILIAIMVIIFLLSIVFIGIKLKK